MKRKQNEITSQMQAAWTVYPRSWEEAPGTVFFYQGSPYETEEVRERI